MTGRYIKNHAPINWSVRQTTGREVKLKRYAVILGYMAPHYATVEVEAVDEWEAQQKAIALASDEALALAYTPVTDNSGPLEVFDWEELP